MNEIVETDETVNKLIEKIELLNGKFDFINRKGSGNRIIVGYDTLKRMEDAGLFGKPPIIITLNKKELGS